MKKVAAPVKKTELTAGWIRCADHAIPSICKKKKKSALTSPTSGGQSVYFACELKATEFSFSLVFIY
jgi:hypothetical protein